MRLENLAVVMPVFSVGLQAVHRSVAIAGSLEALSRCHNSFRGAVQWSRSYSCTKKLKKHLTLYEANCKDISLVFYVLKTPLEKHA